MIDNSLVKIIISKKKQNKFFNFLKKIYKYSNKYEIIIGIDFEFNSKKVALMQILFYIKKKTIKNKYYIIYPPILSIEILDYLKNNILSNVNIIKILHGSESLDLPYIVDDLYNNDLNGIINFILSIVDTRYLCEYINLYEGNENICRIYDLLVNMKIITNDEKNNLDNNEDKMGPIYNINIDIKNLSSELITYSIHDVVYLVDLYNVLKNDIINKNPKDYYLLLDCIRYSFMEKRFISTISEDIILINQMNNYFYNIKINSINNKILLIQMYEIIIKEYFEIYKTFEFIININYLKANILNLLRTVVYVILIKKNKVNISKKLYVDYNLDSNYNLILQNLKILELNFLLDLINNFYDFAYFKLTK